MIINRQSAVSVDLSAARGFVRRLENVLKLRRESFNVCFVDDRAIARLNLAFRRKRRSTDVLSFPWRSASGAPPAERVERRRRARAGTHTADDGMPGELLGFRGDVVVSVETARRNARAAGHSMENEIRWLILHGVLHLLGYDHEADRGEMTTLEMALRERFRQ